MVAKHSLWKGSISLPVPALIPRGLVLQRRRQKRALERFWQLPVHGERVTVGLLPALVQHGEFGIFQKYLDTISCPVLWDDSAWVEVGPDHPLWSLPT